jgi:hypothetical protein
MKRLRAMAVGVPLKFWPECTHCYSGRQKVLRAQNLPIIVCNSKRGTNEPLVRTWEPSSHRLPPCALRVHSVSPSRAQKVDVCDQKVDVCDRLRSLLRPGRWRPHRSGFRKKNFGVRGNSGLNGALRGDGRGRSKKAVLPRKRHWPEAGDCREQPDVPASASTRIG